MKRLPLIVLALLAVVVVGCAGVIDSEGAKIGDPKRFAEATHIAAMSEEAVQATSTAVSLQTTRTAAEISAKATETSLQATRMANDISAVATREAIANAKRQSDADQAAAQATVALSKAKSEVEAQPAQAKGLATAYFVGYIGAGVAVLVLLVGLAFALTAFANTRARVVYPTKSGQMPLVITGNTVLEPNRQLGAGVIIPSKPGALWTVARVVHYLQTGEVLEVPEPQLGLSDGNATADHYLAAAKGASQVATAAAMFQPTKDMPRETKIELLTSVTGLPGITAPKTRVIATGSDAIRAIAGQLGDNIPQLQAPDGDL
jgi:hypothetical protein